MTDAKTIDAEISALNQIAHASQFVDPDVEWTVRSFHHHCFSCAQSGLEQWVGAPPLCEDDLLRAEAKETRFSHISKTIDGFRSGPQRPVSRWPSMIKGRSAAIDFKTVASILAEATGADDGGRRPYPSGGALYSAETILVTSDMVGGMDRFSVVHYLPVSNRFEVVQNKVDCIQFHKISALDGVAFYAAYLINIKKAIFKYRSRGYRLALLEIGSMYQEMARAAQKRGLASRVLSGFCEYEFAKTCGLDSRLFLPVILQGFGYAEN